MNEVIIVVLSVTSLLAVVGCWLGWQLLRQNGRILLRLDELEQRLDELEFDEADEMERGSSEPQHAQSAERGGQPLTRSEDHPLPVGRGEGQGEGQHENRFSNRSLARSKIKRDGLKAGTSAPSFRLPRLDGGELALEELRGKRVLLVFSDPHCGPCNALAPQLEAFRHKHLEIQVVMISRGDPKENRAKVKEHGLTFPIVLQQRWEISRRYAIFATPVAYLIDEAGIIAHDVAVGVEPILALLGQWMAKPEMQIENASAKG